MTREKTQYYCQECGSSQSKWAGQCGDCGSWNSLMEEKITSLTPAGLNAGKGQQIEFVNLKTREDESVRLTTGINEFDRVCGGGLVPGSTLLVGGDPGIGKSTLLLQITAALASADPNAHCIYISGEEATNQIRLRAERLGLSNSPVQLATATNVRDIVSTLESTTRASVAVVDSIQTMYLDNLSSAPGTVSQVRASAQELVQIAKRKNFCLFLVGHVTKEGMIAGPKVLEHMVDTVLYFEGERTHNFRMLRAVKNRFGAIDEIGIFEMKDSGLSEVVNPSSLFLGNQDNKISGTSIFAAHEGTRPMLIEIQALTAPTAFSTPRRAVVGWDSGRLNMVLAVLEARCNINFGSKDVYLNVTGGLKITEPAADFAAAAALVSSFFNCPFPPRSIIFGEIGLSGEIRKVTKSQPRLKEAVKLGFTLALTPPLQLREGIQKKEKDAQDIKIKEIKNLHELISLFENKNSVSQVKNIGG